MRETKREGKREEKRGKERDVSSLGTRDTQDAFKRRVTTSLLVFCSGVRLQDFWVRMSPLPLIGVMMMIESHQHHHDFLLPLYRHPHDDLIVSHESKTTEHTSYSHGVLVSSTRLPQSP